jgi:hypothetical protein
MGFLDCRKSGSDLLAGKMPSRVIGARRKVRRDALARGRSALLNLLGNRIEQGAELLAGVAGILATGVDPQRSIPKTRMMRRRVRPACTAATRRSEPASAAAKLTQGRYLPRRAAMPIEPGARLSALRGHLR